MTSQAAEGGLTAEGCSQPASLFAQTAAAYAQQLAEASPYVHSQAVKVCTSEAQVGGKFQPSSIPPGKNLWLANWTRFESSPSESSFDSEDSASDTCFLPMEEEDEREVQPLPDQAWWEEFGEFESAPQAQVSASQRLHAGMHMHLAAMQGHAWVYWCPARK